MDYLYHLLNNYVLNVSIFAWISAQVLKTLITWSTTGKFQKERLIGAGGMPSAHSATVCAMTIAVSRISGFNSPEFAICCIVAFVVMYDATGVRRAAGEQARRLNQILSHFKKQGIDIGLEEEDDPTENPDMKELKEFLGHTPVQVLAGALLGIIIAMLVPVR